MSDYQIKFKASAAKEFRRLPKQIKLRIGKTIDNLASEPRPTGVKKLKGSENLYCVRVSDYRVIYDLDDSIKIIRIVKIGHRREIYRS